MRPTGAILAGGQSRRMGAPKEGVRLSDGRPMIEHVIETLSAVCSRVVIIGECRGYRCGLPRIADLHPGLGPLAGLETMLASGLDAGYLVLACDQPFVTPELLRRLLPEKAEQLRCFREAGGAGFHPFPCYLPATWLPRVTEALDQGRLALRSLFGASHPDWPVLSIDEVASLRSVNTPADLAVAAA